MRKPTEYELKLRQALNWMYGWFLDFGPAVPIGSYNRTLKNAVEVLRETEWMEEPAGVRLQHEASESRMPENGELRPENKAMLKLLGEWVAEENLNDRLWELAENAVSEGHLTYRYKFDRFIKQLKQLVEERNEERRSADHPE